VAAVALVANKRRECVIYFVSIFIIYRFDVMALSFLYFLNKREENLEDAN
jgi:hypothetical protein